MNNIINSTDKSLTEDDHTKGENIICYARNCNRKVIFHQKLR